MTDGRVLQTTAKVDWRSVLVRYVRAVMDDDLTVGDRCLVPSSAFAPEWTEVEAKALKEVHREAWPEGCGPWSPDKFGSSDA